MSDIPIRPEPYLVTLNQDHIAEMGGESVSLSKVAEDLKASLFRLRAAAHGDEQEPEVKALSLGKEDPHTLVVTLDEDELHALKSRYGNALIIEQDIELDLFDRPQTSTHHNAASEIQPMVPHNFFAAASSELVLEITVKGADGQAVQLAEVSGRGSAVYSVDTAVTNARGKAELTFFAETTRTIRELRVKPSAGYWGLVIARPDLSGLPEKNGKLQLGLTLQPIMLGADEADIWGYKAMGLDRADVGSPVDGFAPRIAIIDSGISATHEDLSPRGGRDFTDRGAPDTMWQNDLSGHGTHVAGTCGADFNARGICGAAGPDAKIYGLSVFPGGRASSLIGALDWCIEHQIDVANMSLGSAQGNNALQQAVSRAVAHGVCLVAAAGNAARAVMFPAAYDEVIAVAAIGAVDSYPTNSPHAEHLGPHQSGPYFAAGFTCFGPQIDVAAPGVAVVSCVPSQDNAAYAAWDGTSMAAPYVAGFVARLLGARPDIRAHQRGSARCLALKSALTEACHDLGLPAEYQGKGMPVWPVDPSRPEDKASMITKLEKISKDLALEIG